ncbi:lamin tail domain-containing protein [Algoriphagus aestuariicola]|uniref:Lamin tail domain-containing protein n=1 Tax=Algoriphagus aestuariicola TaxID=1852016 RepID=A0ABS3BUA9_9BACT|nr:lamin tail domain-containing protein [Algoriphagus aestuariicola]MBN7801915.1 lamin tail domain-containing protein [Algoriphagus aestuariicola]
MKQFLAKGFVLLFPLILWGGVEVVFGQHQDFESNFQLASYPLEFLPNWHGNEVSGSSARIFQADGLGRGGGRALAVQPTSAFVGRIWIRLNPGSFVNPELEFYAKTIRNGSGNRPALLFYAWGESMEGEFSEPLQLGSDSEFSNENQEYRKFSLEVPETLRSAEAAIVKLEIRYGSGAGTAARWLMDDFDFGDLIRDEVPPKVLGVKGYGEKSVLVMFSEAVDQVFSLFPITYGMRGGNPESVRLVGDSLAVLEFADILEPGQSYSLSVSQIPDLEGNFLKDTLVNFNFFDPTAISRKSLVINELMPAPRADQDLPNVEYIELFHAGDREYRMEGIKLFNSRMTTVLDEFWFQPGEYLILAPEAQADQFTDLGPVLPVKNWPTLLNSGDQIGLISINGQEADRISYATPSWGNSDFASGGYSLEVPNPFSLCSNSSFLSSSIDPRRGTPGTQNSIFDPTRKNSSPTIESVYFVDSTHIRLVFSAPIVPDFDFENLSFSPNLAIDSLSVSVENEIGILLSSPAAHSQAYELRVTGLQDCDGGLLPDILATIVLPEIAIPGDLIINEVLFNPRTGDPKFVEIKNVTPKFLSLEGWALANFGEDGNPDQAKVFGGAGSTLSPEGYLAITTDANALQRAYPKSSTADFLEIPTLPSYPIAGGTVVLLSPVGEIQESFSYDEDLHHPLLRDPKGVSLERISHSTPASVAMNWQTASGNEGFATPGRRNSQSLLGEFETDQIQIDPEVFDPEGSSGLSFTSITYQLDHPGWTGTFKIFSASGQLIQVLAQNQILGTDGLLTWTGTDSAGKIVRAGYYVLVVELYEAGGRTSLIKKTIVVATRL